MALVLPPYVTSEVFEGILADLEMTSLAEPKQQEVLNRAVGMMEGKLCARYVVPLVAANGGAYDTAPAFARNMVSNLFQASIRRILGFDNNRNLVIDGTQRFIDLNKGEQKEILEDLLNPIAILGFKLQAAAEGSIGPIQVVGLARADNDSSLVDDPWV